MASIHAPVAASRAYHLGIRPGETAAVGASMLIFFSLLAAYYVVRPLRDEMGVTVGKDNLHHLFTAVLGVMVVAVPAFGFLASRVSRRRILPVAYLAFAAMLGGFWLWFKTFGVSNQAAGLFFVFASVFNLFVVSLFWSLMTELWTHEEATRLYGIIGAGGTAGAILGPLVAGLLVRYIAPADLLPVAAALLLLALAASLLVRQQRPGDDARSHQPIGGGLIDGARRLIEQPYLARIGIYIFLANIVGTFFYLEQSRLVAAEIADSAARVTFFAGRDLVVGLLTLAIELFGTSRIIRKFGATAAIAILPVVAIAGVIALAAGPMLQIVAAVMVIERVIAFSLANPGIKLMYTLTPADDKYKVQNVIDTAVYRGGDAASGWIFAAISRGGGFATAATPVVAVVLALVWLWTALQLGRAHNEKAAH